MTDKEHATQIGKAVAALQSAITEAVGAGLEVDVAVHGLRTVGREAPEPIIEASVRRLIAAGETGNA